MGNLVITAVRPSLTLRAGAEIEPTLLVLQVSRGTSVVWDTRFDVTGLPPGLSMSATSSRLSGMATTPFAGVLTIVATQESTGDAGACDVWLEVTAAQTIDPSQSGESAPVRIESHQPSLTVVVGRQLARTPMVRLSSAEDTFSYSVTPALPAGLGMDAHTGEIFGRVDSPALVGVKPYTLWVRRDTSDGWADSVTFEIVIEPANALQVHVDTPSISATVGVALKASRPIRAAGGEPPYRFSIEPAPTPGLSWDPATGVLAGTPSGRFLHPRRTHVVTVTDAHGVQGAGWFKLSVSRDPTDVSSDELIGEWDEANRVRIRTKGESAAIDAGWAFNGITTKTSLTGVSATNATTSLGISLNLGGVMLPISAVLLNASVAFTGINKSVYCNTGAEYNSTYYKGSHRVTYLDPPPLEVNIAYVDDNAAGADGNGICPNHEWAHQRELPVKNEANIWVSRPRRLMQWAKITENDLKKAGVLDNLNAIPEWANNKNYILNLGDYINDINQQVPEHKLSTLEEANKDVLNKFPSYMDDVGKTLADVAQHNGAVRIDIAKGARQVFTFYSDYFRTFTFGGRTAVHFGTQRDIYLGMFSTVAETELKLVHGPSVHHFRCQGFRHHPHLVRADTPSVAEYRYEGSMAMQSVVAESGGPHAAPEITQVLMSIGMRRGANPLIEAYAPAINLQARGARDDANERDAATFKLVGGRGDVGSNATIQAASFDVESSGKFHAHCESIKFTTAGGSYDFQGDKVIYSAQVHVQ